MTEFTPEAAGLLARRVLFHEWRQQVAAGLLTENGLLELRGRLDETNPEFEPGPDKESLYLLVADAIARRRGIDPADMPGAPVAPDDVSGLED
ncbi:hypothetical protein ACFWUU_02095 [Kribbella sp. NPDC058693]|uniref:hypothetical protein n=1 Tax=Kribbella sp. NPDC058693 TaxID=3346602 RepID=UPI003650C51F